jgi:hypothetical protein
MLTEHAELGFLLVLVDHRTDDATTQTRISEILERRALNWSTFLNLALFHKVAFLAWDRLHQLGALEETLRGGMPLLLFNHWTQLHRVNQWRTNVQFDALRAIAISLDDAGVTWAVGKGGPLLLGSIYRPGARKMYDLDLIAPRDQLEAVVAGMSAAQFVMGTWSPDRSVIDPLAPGDLRQWLIHSRGLPNFLRVGDDRIVDYLVAQVQFMVGSTANGTSVPAERLLERRSPMRMAWGEGESYLVPAPCVEDVFIQLAVHISRETLDPEHAEWHMNWNIIKLSDLARFAEHTSIESEAILDRANELGFGQHVRYAVAAALRVFPSDRLEALATSLSGRSGDNLGEVAISTDLSLTSLFLDVADGRTRKLSSWTDIVGVKTS